MHTCEICNLTFEKGVLLSNHVRWHHKERKQPNFLLKCSCLECGMEVTVQNLTHHGKTHEPKIIKYNRCKFCNNETTNESFCNPSCSAKHNNKLRTQESREKQKQSVKCTWSTKPKRARNQKQLKKTICPICGVEHHRINTCSDTCKRKLTSLKLKQRIYNRTWNPNLNRGRGKKSYMESSFETWVKTNFPGLQFFYDKPFKRLDMIKTYFVDFYFPSKNLIIELDGTQHLKTIEYDANRDDYLKTTYGVNIVRISYKEYKNKSRINEIIQLLS